MTQAQYIAQLTANAAWVEADASALDSASAVPHLHKYLFQHGGGRYARLYQIHRYMLDYLNTAAMPPAIIDGVYYVAMAQDVLRSKHGGTPRTWRKYLTEFKALGLLTVYNPAHHVNRFETAEQRYSIGRANEKGWRPVCWYSVPQYDTATLTEADNRASALLCKAPALYHVDTVRDILGDAIANATADTVKGISEETVQRRESLYKALQGYLCHNGYLSTEMINAAVRGVCEATGETFVIMERTMQSYKPKVMRELGVKYVRPTAEEKQRFHLVTNKYIYTARQ